MNVRNKMRDTCVICRKRGVKHSIEHVIPEAIGGYYILKDKVCVRCNSKLGDSVDSPLVNHAITKIYRFAHGLAGKSGKIQNPFPGEFALQTDPSKKVKLKPDRDGKLVPRTVTNVRRGELPDNRVQLEISVDPVDETKIESIVSKITTRMNATLTDPLADAERSVEHVDGALKGSLAVDLRAFKLCMLKIAYEFTIDCIPTYFQTREAKEISDILKEARVDDVEEFVNVGNGFNLDLSGLFGRFLDFSELKHYLILCGIGNKFVCFVHLHNLFSIGVTLADRSFGEFLKVGVNDVKERTFKIWEPKDFFGLVDWHPRYHFETQQEAEAFYEAIRTNQSDLENKDGSWKLFQKDGIDLGLTVDDLIAQLSPLRSSLDDTQISSEYCLPEGLYVRLQGTNLQAQVRALRVTQAIERV